MDETLLDTIEKRKTNGFLGFPIFTYDSITPKQFCIFSWKNEIFRLTQFFVAQYAHFIWVQNKHIKKLFKTSRLFRGARGSTNSCKTISFTEKTLLSKEIKFCLRQTFKITLQIQVFGYVLYKRAVFVYRHSHRYIQTNLQFCRYFMSKQSISALITVDFKVWLCVCLLYPFDYIINTFPV